MRKRKHEEIARELDGEFDGTAEVIEVAMNDDLGDELLGLNHAAFPRKAFNPYRQPSGIPNARSSPR
jgi:hypothetical protein